MLDPAATPLLARRTAGASLFDKLFALQVLGDDRAIASTYVAGDLAHASNRLGTVYSYEDTSIKLPSGSRT